jgi:tetratricopeptide (TPR) repeat protein
MEVVKLNCPGCGGPVSSSIKTCEYCSRPIVITTFSSVQSLSTLELNKYANAYRKELAANPDSQTLNMSLAMCYMKLKLYDKAIPAFEKAMEDNFDNSETFFYAAVSLLKGQKAFVTPRADIDKAVEYLNAAIMIEPKGIYYLFLAYIKQDYFERKYLNTSPKWTEALQSAIEADVSEADIMQLAETLQVEMPDCLIV